MARMIRLKDILPFGKVKTPGFGISPRFYLSVLANTPVLPGLLAIINPKGEEGAVAGFGVPLRKDASKEDLRDPMIRGFYALASPSQKTLLKLTVVSKEEAGFDPEPMLRSEVGQQLPVDVRARIAAAWNMIQITFESHDPLVYPALDFLLAVAERTAQLTQGVVADPICQVYRLPGEIIQPFDKGLPFATQAHVAVRELPGDTSIHLSTQGLSKFNIPEFELDGVSPEAVVPGKLFLLGLAQSSLKGSKLEPGDKVGEKGLLFRVAEGGFDRRLWDGIPCLEVIPDAAGQTSANLIAWHEQRKQ